MLADNISSSGEINIIISDFNNNLLLKLIGEGKYIRFKKQNLDILQGSYNSEINIENCREYYINDLCARQGYEIELFKKTTLIEYRIVK